MCFDLILEGGNFFGDGGEGGSKWLHIFFRSGKSGPASMAFLEEVSGLYEVVKGVDHLDDLEVFCFEFGLDSLVCEFLCNFLKEGK